MSRECWVWLPTLLVTSWLCVPALSAPKSRDDGNLPTFDTRRPVKAVVVGGSIAAFPGAGFGAQLEEVCSNLEVTSIAKARLSAAAIAQRFNSLVLGNRKLFDRDTRERWVLIQGGLNSVGNPTRTNADLLELFRMAHRAGIRVFALSLSPWGRESDADRWAGINGIGRQNNTQRAVDFVMGRLTPVQALGRHAAGQKDWKQGDLPDAAVDLYDSDLRDRDAPLRPEAPLREALDRDPVMTRMWSALPVGEQRAKQDAILRQAREIPRWYLRPELQSFDHIHPNRDGHRIIALEVCRKAPASWGCDCTRLRTPAAPP